VASYTDVASIWPLAGEVACDTRSRLEIRVWVNELQIRVRSQNKSNRSAAVKAAQCESPQSKQCLVKAVLSQSSA
jgi:hypothetical protein